MSSTSCGCDLGQKVYPQAGPLSIFDELDYAHKPPQVENRFSLAFFHL